MCGVMILKSRMIVALWGALIGAMLVYPSQAAEAAWHALSLWARSVVPALFPFLIGMLMLGSRIRAKGGTLVALGWLSGSPGGARLLQQQKPAGRYALRLAALTGTMSPMFFLSTLSGWLMDSRAGIIMLAAHLLGALSTGLMVPAHPEMSSTESTPLPLATALQNAATAMLTVAGCMTLGCVAARMTACALPGLGTPWMVLLQCLLEVTAGTQRIIAVDTTLKIPLLCAACSFGGLSLGMQNAAFFQESGVTLMQLLKLRAVHALVAFALCYGMCLLFL